MAELETIEVEAGKWHFSFNDEQVHYLGCLLRYAQATHYAKGHDARRRTVPDLDVVAHTHGARMATDLLAELVDVVGNEDAGGQPTSTDER